MKIVKACGCGLSFTDHEWSLLKFVGMMADEVETIEIRNCPCGSSIAVEASEPPWVECPDCGTKRPLLSTGTMMGCATCGNHWRSP